MSLTPTQARSLPKTGAIALVAMLHAVMFYAISNGLNTATIVKPLESMVAVFVPEDRPQPPPEPVEKIQIPDAQPSDLPIEEPSPVPIEIPPEVAVSADSGPTVAAQPQSSPIPETTSFSIKSRVDPAYPSASRRAGEQGTVILELVVGPDGRPTAVNVERSSGYDALDQAAVAAVKKWRFATNGTGLVRLHLPVTFKLETAR